MNNTKTSFNHPSTPRTGRKPWSELDSGWLWVTGTYWTLWILAALIIFLFPGCGKNETAGTTLGAAGGGLIGHTVAGKHDKTAGVLVGSLLGGLVGNTIGKAADEDDEVENHLKAERQRELEYLHEENKRLRQNLVTWCSSCGRRCELVGAHSCAACGAPLIHEKYCTECKTIFTPQSGYKYCPYCKDHVLLSSR
jgi:hypothetical protein